MSKGRRPKPKEIDSASTVASMPEPPDWLDEIARQEWNRVAPILSENGVLTEADVTALGVYCQTYSQYVECQRNINEKGLVHSGKLNPLARHADTLTKQLRGLITEFGFTPSSRGRMEPAEPADPDAEALKAFL